MSGLPCPRPRLDVVLPIHNEAASVAFVVEEIFERACDGFDLRVIASEDGSNDGTQDVLAELAARFPLVVCSRIERGGYAAAVIEGLRATESDWVLAMDADGQCDPADIQRLWAARDAAPIVIGDRRRRCDGIGRRLVSRAFGLVYRILLGVRVRDPSCPLVLLRRVDVFPLLGGLGRMPYGWWWEFVAMAHRRGLKIAEVPITHRPRLDGRTRVFSARALPRLALSQLRGLGRLWLESRRLNAERYSGKPVPP